MATLKSNGKCYCEMKVYRKESDGAESDEMSKTTIKTYRAMENGKMLKKVEVVIDYGIGIPKKYTWGWKVSGKLKQNIIGNKDEIKKAMQAWQESLISKGIDAEIS